MSDNRFTYLHMTAAELDLLDDSEDEELLNEPLPDEDIEVPPGLVPPFQDEEDENVLPSASHPSYPYGNPYTLSLLPLRPSARSTKKGLKGNPHTRHIHTWTDLALEDLLPWEGEEPDMNFLAGLEAEAAAAAHAAATAAAAGGAEGEMEVQMAQAQDEAGQGPEVGAPQQTATGGSGQGQEQDQEPENSEEGSEGSDGSE